MSDVTRDGGDPAAPEADGPRAQDAGAGADVAAAGPGAAEAQPEDEAGKAGVAVAGTAEPADDGDSGGLRFIGAVVTLPWVLLYGVTGVWAVTLAARAASEGLEQLDAGYTRYVSPAALAFVGVLLIVAFAVMLSCGLLLLFRRRSAMVWLPLLLVACGLTAGALWAGIEGNLHPALWLFLFFGLVYAVVVAAVKVLHVTRVERRGTIAPP